MTPDQAIEDMIATWLAESAPRRAPERILVGTFSWIDATAGIGHGPRRVRVLPTYGWFLAVVLVFTLIALALVARPLGSTGAPTASPGRSLAPSPTASQLDVVPRLGQRLSVADVELVAVRSSDEAAQALGYQLARPEVRAVHLVPPGKSYAPTSSFSLAHGVGLSYPKLFWVVEMAGTFLLCGGSTGCTEAPSGTLAIDDASGQVEGVALDGPGVNINSPALVSLPSIERAGARIVAGQSYTSDRFPVRFALTSGAQDWCPAQTSADGIVLPYRDACIADIRLLRPYAIDCGTPTQHPDAATFAAALQAKAGLAVTSPPLPPGLFVGMSTAYIVRLYGGRLFDRNATDPDHCRILGRPGSGDATIEIRGDMPAELVLIDNGGLFYILRSASSGFDAASGAIAEGRGYFSGANAIVDQLMTGIYGIDVPPWRTSP